MLRGFAQPPARYETWNEALAAAAASSEGIVFVDDCEGETTLPYRTLYAQSKEAAGALARLGVSAGERVALVLPTSPEFVSVFFGVLLAGAVPVPLYPPLRLTHFESFQRRTVQMVKSAGASLIVTSERLTPFLHEIAIEAGPSHGLVLAERLQGPSAAFAAAPDALALVQFSSGTTVEPKPVALTHRQLLANVAAIDAYLSDALGPEIRGVSWLPLYHDMGLVGCLLSSVHRASRLVLLRPESFLASPALWLRAITRHRAQVSPAPHFAYGFCTKRVRDGDVEGVDLSSWQLALDGAETVSPEALGRFADRFGPQGFDAEALTPVYGLAEASLAVTFAPAGRALRRLAHDPARLAGEGAIFPGKAALVGVGTPVSGVEVELRDDAGRPLPEGRRGRIWVRAPGVMQGYLGQPEATAATLREGWLDTGDLGVVSGNELFVCGRAKEVVVLRGANHAPQEFEACLSQIPGVRPGAVAAFGYRPADAESEVLGIVAEVSGPPDEALVARIRGEVCEYTGIVPHGVWLVEAGTLPRTSSGKLRRLEVARTFGGAT